MQHLAPLIIERVNRFLGYEAVAKLVFRQGRAAKAAAQPKRPVAAPIPKELGEGLREIADPELRACLESLASKLAGSRGAPAVDNFPTTIHSHHPEQMILMRITYLFLASAALLATACNAEKGATNSSGPEVTAAAVPAPNNGDWSTVVTKTPEGGFVMGNPNAKVKLVEFGSMTCPHCAEFEEQGGKALIDNYVKKGLVSWEFRNFVRDPFDMAATLLARCGGEANFFGMTRNLFHDQRTGSASSRPPTRRVAGSADAAAGAAILDHRRPRRPQDLRGAARRSARQGRPVPGQRSRRQPAGADEQRRRFDLFDSRHAGLPDQRHAWSEQTADLGDAGTQDEGSTGQLR